MSLGYYLWQQRCKAALGLTFGIAVCCIVSSKLVSRTFHPTAAKLEVQVSIDKLVTSLLELNSWQAEGLDDTTLGKLPNLEIVSGTTCHGLVLAPRPLSRYMLGSGAARHLEQRRPSLREVALPCRHVRSAAVQGNGVFGLDPDVEKRMREGNPTFDDYMKAMNLMYNLRCAQEKEKSVPDIFSSAPLTRSPELDAIEHKVQRFQGIIDTMTVEERSSPDLFFDSSLSRDVTLESRIARLAQSSGEDPEIVRRLLFEFKAMREVESRAAKGEQFEDIQSDLQKWEDRTQETSTGNGAQASEDELRQALDSRLKDMLAFLEETPEGAMPGNSWKRTLKFTKSINAFKNEAHTSKEINDKLKEIDKFMTKMLDKRLLERRIG